MDDCAFSYARLNLEQSSDEDSASRMPKAGNNLFLDRQEFACLACPKLLPDFHELITYL